MNDNSRPGGIRPDRTDDATMIAGIAGVGVGDVLAVLDRRIDALPVGTLFEHVVTGATVRVVAIPGRT